MSKNYSITEESKKQFAGVYLLNYMINGSHTFPVYLERDNEALEPVLEWLLTRDYVCIQNKEKYIPTEKGREVLKRFLARYTDYLNVYDVFCAVDLETGEFAFASYFDYENDGDWRVFLKQSRWEDLRIAVAGYKKLDPVEIVFMSFVSENRFGQDQSGWQFDLLLGNVWDEISQICETAIHWEDLGYEDEQGQVNAETVIHEIIRQGAELTVELHTKESRLTAERESEFLNPPTNGEEQVVERVYVEEQPVVYYENYYDPFYVSPIWLALWLI